MLKIVQVLPKRNLYFLAALSGVILSLGWPPGGFAPLLFIAFVPLLLVEYEIHSNSAAYKGVSLFGAAYTAFFTWNLISTYWIYHASLGGAAMAILANSLLMATVFLLQYAVKKKIGFAWGNVALIFFWITFEYTHFHWDISWTWLTLGNGFAHYYKWIQWYEYTGVFGGSLWILLVNVLIAGLVKKIVYRRSSLGRNKIMLFIILACIVLPIILSYVIYEKYEEKSNPVNVVVVQPNIDPYNEKFSGSFQEQLQGMLKQASEKVDSTTDYLVFPETALTEDICENNIVDTYSIALLKKYLSYFPKLKIVIGAATYRNYEKESECTETARKYRNGDTYYDSFNTAFQIDHSKIIQVYHKSKLVPGVEKMPFPAILKPLEGLAINLGGTIGSLGTQDERTVFPSPDNTMKIAPIICYESVFGEFVGEFVKNGAQLIFIITNDGWWGDTPGYKQHLAYASLRAIETRRSIARSANTGISCFINQRGDVSRITNWWEPDVIGATINANDSETFYVKKGDYIGLLSIAGTLIILIVFAVLRFSSRAK